MATDLIINNITQSNHIESPTLGQQYVLGVPAVTSLWYITPPIIVFPASIATLEIPAVTSNSYISVPAPTIALYFPWGATGWANQLEVTEISETVRHEYPGYTAKRPRTTRMQKAFRLQWVAMTNAQWLALITFWRRMRGAAGEFFFEFPLELYGAGGYGGVDGKEPQDGFDAEGGYTYGEGPTFLVSFASDELPQRYLTHVRDRWEASAQIVEVS